MSAHPNQLAQLLSDLGAAGIDIAPDPTNAARLRHRPRMLPPSLAARLRLAKPAVLAALRGECIPDQADTTSEGGYVMGERLGIADELGYLTHAGSPAWLIAAGEGLVANC